MPMGKSAKSCAQLKAEPPYLLRLITKNVAVYSNTVKPIVADTYDMR